MTIRVDSSKITRNISLARYERGARYSEWYVHTARFRTRYCASQLFDVFSNIVDPDETAPVGAVSSGSTMFA